MLVQDHGSAGRDLVSPLKDPIRRLSSALRLQKFGEIDQSTGVLWRQFSGHAVVMLGEFGLFLLFGKTRPIEMILRRIQLKDPIRDRCRFVQSSPQKPRCLEVVKEQVIPRLDVLWIEPDRLFEALSGSHRVLRCEQHIRAFGATPIGASQPVNVTGSRRVGGDCPLEEATGLPNIACSIMGLARQQQSLSIECTGGFQQFDGAQKVALPVVIASPR